MGNAYTDIIDSQNLIFNEMHKNLSQLSNTTPKLSKNPFKIGEASEINQQKKKQ